MVERGTKERGASGESRDLDEMGTVQIGSAKKMSREGKVLNRMREKVGKGLAKLRRTKKGKSRKGKWSKMKRSIVGGENGVCEGMCRERLEKSDPKKENRWKRLRLGALCEEMRGKLFVWKHTRAHQLAETRTRTREAITYK